MPIDPSSMTRWRKRLGEAGAEQMLRATIEAGMKMKAICDGNGLCGLSCFPFCLPSGLPLRDLAQFISTGSRAFRS
jgi:hypothetical protein